MYVLENGTVLIKKMSGRVVEVVQLTSNTEITELKDKRLKIKQPKYSKIFESDDSGVWVCVLNVLKNRRASSGEMQSIEFQ